MIRIIAANQGGNYTTGCFLGYLYFKAHYKMIAIDLSKQQTRMLIQGQWSIINFTGNINQEATMFFIIKVKETIKVFSKETVWVFEVYFALL